MGRGRLKVELRPLSEGAVSASVTLCKLLEQIFWEMAFPRSKVTIALIGFS